MQKNLLNQRLFYLEKDITFRLKETKISIVIKTGERRVEEILVKKMSMNVDVNVLVFKNH